MLLTTPMEFKHICFVDTPGYNPAENNESDTSTDFQIAGNFVTNADALIWLIYIGSGTVPKSDIDFLQEFGEDKNIYIVLNKADLRSKENIEEVIDSVCEILDDNDIEYMGISAYSSVQAKEIIYREMSLTDFLNKFNKAPNYHQKLLPNIENICNPYQDIFRKKIESKHKNIEILENLRRKLIESNVSNFDLLEDKIIQLKAEFDIQSYQEGLKFIEAVMQSYIENVMQLHIEEIKKLIKKVEM